MFLTIKRVSDALKTCDLIERIVVDRLERESRDQEVRKCVLGSARRYLCRLVSAQRRRCPCRRVSAGRHPV